MNNKFGMFIHWGVYSLTELHEQAYARYDMKRADYEALMHRFDPTDYDPEAWVLLAKSAGMKYICFTAKHHDGFCMWDTKCTDYNITKTPYGKDVLKMLAEACIKHGMLLSLYYSNPDWHHEFGYNPSATHQWKCVDKEKVNTEEYRKYIKEQITELLTGYGKIYTLFWDIPPHIEDPSLNELARSLQPDILINDRGWDKGDFSTPEREEPVGEEIYFKRMTEACNSVGRRSWGYRRDEDFYSLRHLTYSIDKIMCMGGSYLLNVGPDSKGRITSEYADRIVKIGEWYNRMKHCLEDAEPDSYEYSSVGAKCIATKKNGKTYLHFYQGIISSSVTLSRYPSIPARATLVNTSEPLAFSEVYMPDYYNSRTGKCEHPLLRIKGIPVDELQSEPIVIEIEWQ